MKRGGGGGGDGGGEKEEEEEEKKEEGGRRRWRGGEGGGGDGGRGGEEEEEEEQGRERRREGGGGREGGRREEVEEVKKEEEEEEEKEEVFMKTQLLHQIPLKHSIIQKKLQAAPSSICAHLCHLPVTSIHLYTPAYSHLLLYWFATATSWPGIRMASACSPAVIRLHGRRRVNAVPTD
ncbi:hypothetical protein D4764_0184780 [Takifugu flavidus]|uniref:Uncharacterized protein n=1 Tax=Takifugu flavidus TaxID=433684 RepID=A0A5C6MG30_9TELE|nr:hypothetical protein D4764_0184780 [Takifugu flavidus]